MKIAILTRQETMTRCTGHGCLKAFNRRLDAFSHYGPEVELAAFTHSGGDLDRKIERLKAYGVEAVHLSTCLRGKCPAYDALAQRLSVDFQVVGYTHGSMDRKGSCQGCSSD